MDDGRLDNELVRRFQDGGDYEAFETLFHRHRDGLFGFLLALSENEAIAQEVSQSTWMKLLEIIQRGGYRADKGATFRTFLFTLARNHFIDQFVRKSEVSRTESLMSDDPRHATSIPSDGESEVARAQLRGHVDQALAALPFEQREVITLWASGFTTEQMVSTVGAPRDTVLSRKKYALKKLRRYFDERGVSHER